MMKARMAHWTSGESTRRSCCWMGRRPIGRLSKITPQPRRGHTNGIDFDNRKTKSQAQEIRLGFTYSGFG
jgi:hypothetical protein